MTRFLVGILAICLVTTLGACYKTGEIIFQTTCKPIRLSMPKYLLGIDRGTGVEVTIQYGFTNKRPVTIQYKDGFNNLVDRFELHYDDANNLIREELYTGQNSNTIVAFVTYSYPPGTSSSIAESFDKNYYVLDKDGVTYNLFWSRKYYFNQEFQVEKITTNGKPYADFSYDFGGNLVNRTVYTTQYDSNAPAGEVYFTQDFEKYDDKINLFRSDRYLQLFYDVYSKNNPGKSKRNFGFLADGTPIFQDDMGEYTYNSLGYWITCEPGGYYVVYDCYQP